MNNDLLPVHGFVLAGGKSSRMGQDKALLRFRDRPMVGIAVEKLREFCAEVWIAGNRDDLSGFAPLVREERVDAGPAAGIEAGLKAAKQEWAMFVPVDVPLVPGELLRWWVLETLSADEGFVGSYLCTGAQRHPAFCMLRTGTVSAMTSQLDCGERRLEKILEAIQAEFGEASVVAMNAAKFAPEQNPAETDMEYWFANVNTPEELVEAERWADIVAGGEAGPQRG